MRWLLVGVALLWFWPQQSYASIVISEVAWMGTEVSANDEWIELYNNGDNDVLLDGWVLTDGDKLEIKLAGAIGAGQYIVLERTNDDSAPGPAFLLYSGALKNTGANLLLKKADGTVAQELIGGDDWQEIGGSNKTKETAQYTEQGWVTGVATPGEMNVKASEKKIITPSDKPFTFAHSDTKSAEKLTVDKSELTLQVAAAGEAEVPNVLWPYLALVGLLSFSTVSVFATKSEI